MYMSDEQIQLASDQDPACICVHSADETAAQAMQRIRHRDTGRFHGLKVLSESLQPRYDTLIEVEFENGLVKGEAKVLLTFLLDTLVHKCRAWHQGYLEHTAVLGPTNWHVPKQDGGKAILSTAPRRPPQ